MDVITQVAIVGLAAGYLLRAWQTGSIFASVIAELETGCVQAYVEKRSSNAKFRSLASKLEELLLCPLCLAPYAAAAMWLLIATAPAIGHAIAVIFASAQIAYWFRSK